MEIDLGHLKIYKVGGAVRDKLLGLKPKDTDYVVVGSTVEEMVNLGFKPVGKDFPVFLHPITHEEYALARSEKKEGVGYKGFKFYTNPNITIEEDLKRRDFTINAIAEDLSGNLIDPFNGIKDLALGIIRHVSPSFIEDPLRLIRAARFSATFNFQIAPETLELMKEITKSGELKFLSLDRIKLEFAKAINTNYIYNFFSVLNQVGALEQIIPGFSYILNDSELNAKFISLLDILTTNHCNEILKTVLVFYFLLTNNPHLEHEPNLYLNSLTRELTNLLLKYYNVITNLKNTANEQIYNLIKEIDPFRKSERFTLFSEIINFMAHKIFISQGQEILASLFILNQIVESINKLDYSQIITSPTNAKYEVELAKKNIIEMQLKLHN